MLSGSSVNITNPAQNKELDKETVSEINTNLPVTEADLHKVWNEYANLIQTESPHIYSILINRQPKLSNNTEINIELLGQSQEIELMKEKEQILNFLKNNLKNNQLKLKTIISRDKIPDISEPMTNSDILKAMIIKNPALGKLRVELNLELE